MLQWENWVADNDRGTERMYMETIWMRALNKKLQKKALVQKRSAIYAVMQNKFAGNLHYPGAVFEK